MLEWTNDVEGELAEVSITICRIEDSYDYRVIVTDEVEDVEGGHQKELWKKEGLNKWELFENGLNWVKENCLPNNE